MKCTVENCGQDCDGSLLVNNKPVCTDCYNEVKATGIAHASEADTCEECGSIIKQEDYITEPDGYEEYWGAMVPRPDVVTGYVCPKCGHKGEW